MTQLERLHLAYVGVDIHKDHHAAIVLDCFGDRLGSRPLANREGAFAGWLAAVQALAPGKHLVFGLENSSTWGRALAAYLLAQGQTVRDVAPIRTKRERKHRPHPEKNDEQDALLIAQALLKDLRELPVTQGDALHWTLSLTLSQREGLVRERNRVKNRLHTLLQYPYPDYRGYFSEPFGKTALAFWQRYPSPGHLAGVSSAALGEFLRDESHYALGRKRAEAILLTLAPAAAAPPYQGERDALLREQIVQLRHLEQSIARTVAQLGALVAKLDPGLMTLEGVDTVLAAELLVGIGPGMRFSTADKLARYAGIAPKEWRSAGKGNRTRSAHGQRSLHATFFHLAVIHVQVNRKGVPRCPESRAYYEKKLQEGKSKKAALTCLMRVLVRVVWRLLKQGQRSHANIASEAAD